jgi:hypothetical protein
MKVSAVADRASIGLAAFDARLQRHARMRWPGTELAPDDPIEVETGPGDLLLLRHAPSRRFIGGEPTHQSLMIELTQPLTSALPGALALGKIVYRMGTERIMYQSTSAAGTVLLRTSTAAGSEFEITLRFDAPQLDVEALGRRQLSGTVWIDAVDR